jgi:hypothetical protein
MTSSSARTGPCSIPSSATSCTTPSFPWGVGDSRTIETFGPGGARSRFLYAGRKPRVNAYGDVSPDAAGGADGRRRARCPHPSRCTRCATRSGCWRTCAMTLAMQLAVYAGDPDYGQPGRIDELDRPKIERLAELLDFPFDWGDESDQRRQAAMLLNRYGQRATIFILDKARAFTQSVGKTFLVAFCPTRRKPWRSRLQPIPAGRVIATALHPGLRRGLGWCRWPRRVGGVQPGGVGRGMAGVHGYAALGIRPPTSTGVRLDSLAMENALRPRRSESASDGTLAKSPGL